MPSRFVLAVIASPAGVVTMTVAVTTALPDGSVTWPRSVPEPAAAWAEARMGPSAAIAKRRIAPRYFGSNPKLIESPELLLDEAAASEVHCAAASPPGAPLKLHGVRMDCPL